MDRNQVIGLLLIGAILIGFSIYTQPSAEEMAAVKRQRDSIELLQKTEQQKAHATAPTAAKISINSEVDSLSNDSIKAALAADHFGVFAAASHGTEEFATLENELIKVTLTTRGGRIKNVVLKKYKTFDGKPVTLFESDSTRFGLNFFAQNRSIATNDLFFKIIGNTVNVTGTQQGSITMRLEAEAGKFIDYIYTLKGTSYLVGYKIGMNGLNDVIAANNNYLQLDWQQQLQNMEREATNERINATIYYQYSDGEVDYLTETSDGDAELKTKVKWVSMKQHFFTQVLIADQSFDKPTHVQTVSATEEDLKNVKTTTASFTIPYAHGANESFGMQFYFGPNHYKTLKAIGYDLQKQIPLGWGIFGWVNRFIVIPIFNWLDGFSLNYGIIILILTIAIKVMLLPLTYKAYLSQAKMKVLKPEMEEIQAKHKEEPMKLQQEMMGLYRKAGVSPMGGCWPMLLQLPILFAMLKFFPSSIELRQQSFLWAKDLSTYDSILDLPFHIPFYGAHVSLFTLLMTASTIMLTFFNSQMTSTNPQMKWMMYLMPVFFMGFLNSFSAGLNYYYFLANVISIGQQYLFRSFVDEDAIHKQIQDNKKKPVQKSKFQKRLEDMAKQKGYKLPK